jgi:hypothetical protein
MRVDSVDLGNSTPAVIQEDQGDAARKECVPASVHWHWMHHFLTEETSPLHRPLVELQRRAIWICAAVALQALNQIDYHWYLAFDPALVQWGAFISFTLILSSLFALYMAFRPAKAGASTGEQVRRHPTRWQRLVLIAALLASLGGVAELGVSIFTGFFMPPQFTNDGTSLDTYGAMVLLQGHDPYTDTSILSIVRRFPIDPSWTTPLREGQLADSLEYPSTWELRSILDTDLKSGSAPEFESKVSYPALAFLTLVPLVWLHIYNVLPFYLLCYIVLVAIGWKVARREVRPLLLLISMANVGMWSSVVGGNVDLLYIVFILLAWLVLEQRWWSAIFLGVAIAAKQQAWFLLPFYAIVVYRRYGLQETVRRLGIAAIIFLAFNLPFILWNPQAWLAGVLAPLLDPMFPMGVGIVSLGTTPIFSFLPASVYMVMEAIAMLVCLGWYWRICRACPEAAMLLAFVPLFFAWRSLSSYFYCSALPLFILIMARMLPREDILLNVIQS